MGAKGRDIMMIKKMIKRLWLALKVRFLWRLFDQTDLLHQQWTDIALSSPDIEKMSDE